MEDVGNLLPFMLRLEVIHQLILPHEAIHTLARAVSKWAIEVLGAGLVALQVTVKVAWAAEGFRASDVRTRKSTIEGGGSTAGDGRRNVASVVLCVRQGCRIEHASMSGGGDVVRVVACEGDSVCVRRYGAVRCKRAGEMDLHMSIEALFIGASEVAAVKQTDQEKVSCI